MSNRVTVAVSGLAWMGAGVGSIDAIMEKRFLEVNEEVLITSYSISTSADSIFNRFLNVLERGIVIKIIINQLNYQPSAVQNELCKLQKQYPHFQLFNFSSGDEVGDLHSKVIVFDRKYALVGSSNLTRRGMLNNHELAVLVEGNAAHDIANTVDKLFSSPYVSLFQFL